MYENLFKSPFHRVFVYGTLKRGEPNHKLIENKDKGYAKFVGIGSTVTKYPLVIATKYNIPFLLKHENHGHHVMGEIYDVDSKMLKNLDELEEHPTFYNRVEDQVRMLSESGYNKGEKFEETGELIKAWIYFLPKFRRSLLDGTFYTIYENNGEHGLKYTERYSRQESYNHRAEVNDNETAKPEDVI